MLRIPLSDPKPPVLPNPRGPRALLLAERCAHAFTERSLRLGRALFEEEAVAIRQTTGTRVLAAVRGGRGRPSVVGMDFADVTTRELLAAGCDCPNAFEGHFCKHLYATLLEIDAAGLEIARAAAACARLDLVPLREDLAAVALAWFGEGAEDEGAPAPSGDRPPRAAVSAADAAPARPRIVPPQPDWRSKLSALRRATETWGTDDKPHWPAEPVVPRDLHYVLSLERSREEEALVIELMQRAPHRGPKPRHRGRAVPGGLRGLRPYAIAPASVAELPDGPERRLLALLLSTPLDDGTHLVQARGSTRHLVSRMQFSRSAVPSGTWDVVLPALAATGRFEVGANLPSGARTLSYDDGPPFRFELSLARQGRGGRGFLLRGVLVRAGQVRALDEALLVLPDGLAVFPGRVARLALASPEEAHWLRFLRGTPGIACGEHEDEALLAELIACAGLPRLTVAAGFPWQLAQPVPEPRITFLEPGLRGRMIVGEVTFQYGVHAFPPRPKPSGHLDRERKEIVLRDAVLERRLLARLGQLGARPEEGGAPGELAVRASDLSRVVRVLAGEGWFVVAHGRRVRAPGPISMRVASGVDWFDLEASIDFGGISVTLPELLRALRKKSELVRLDDGTEGVLPEAWLERYAPLAEMGEIQGDAIRFARSQALLLDLLLASQPEAAADDAFARARERLAGLERVGPLPEPEGFAGQLRDYQKEGLGWLAFLDEIELGGCLADDMGLGKTVQVLAALAHRRARARAAGHATRPSLVVAPRSLVHGWRDEAARFVPGLRVLDHTGQGRAASTAVFDAYDLVITTYGTVRRDIAQLEKYPFDLVVLDEAQLIKNHASQASKACRLLDARQRLALSGTPVENHVLELWSIFEFLNPKMLGSKRDFTALAGSLATPGGAAKVTGGGDLDGSPERAADPGRLGRRDGLDAADGPVASVAPDRPTGPEGAASAPPPSHAGESMLARAVRPLILRRTKEQVLSELPPKTELTIHCELEGDALRLYEELRDHYRASLEQRIERDGLDRAKMHVLEALLRLRQAACHPGLIDPARRDLPSAKLEALLAHLTDVIAGGHKALIFSQFVSFLEIVRRRLQQADVDHEYLDGSTRDRPAHIDRFQQDPACKVFLISLKAGGLGLNLTAADYVFILDPWWNPAVEAQAIDRAHRIGQARAVFAYRLIASGTVEEKIIALQAEKRKLVQAIIGEDASVLSRMTVEDLRLLLG